MSLTLEHTRQRQHFHCLHSRTGACLLVGNFYVYPDGGRMEKGPYGSTIDPPTDLYQLTLVQIQYWQAAFEAAAEQFTEMKESLERCVYACRRNGMPPPPESELENLKKAKKLVREYQTKLVGYQARAEKFMPLAMKQRQRASVAVQIDSEAFAQSLGKIKL